MSANPKKKIEKVKDATKEGTAGGHIKNEPSDTGGSTGNGGMIGEGDDHEGRTGGMKSES